MVGNGVGDSDGGSSQVCHWWDIRREKCKGDIDGKRERLQHKRKKGIRTRRRKGY